MTRIPVVFIMFQLAFVGMSFGQSHLWSKGMGGTGQDVGYGITTDLSNNVFITGKFSNTVDFGGGGITSGGNDDIFLVKYNVFGVFQWSKAYGGPANQQSNEVVVDPAGNIYITGYFTDSLDFGGGNKLIGTGSGDFFVAKLDGNGDYIWARTLANSSWMEGKSLGIDANGNVYVAGNFMGGFTFNSSSFSGAGGLDGFFLKYDSNGNEAWCKTVEGLYNDVTNDLVIDPAGNIYVIGEFTYWANIDGSSTFANGLLDCWVIRYDSTGNKEWTNIYGGSGDERGYSITIDSNADLFITGEYENTVNFGGGGITSGGNDDIFLVKLDTAGSHIWTRGFGGTGVDEGHAVTVDIYDNVYITGRFFNTVDFGGGGLTSGGDDDIFVVGYTGTGNYIFANAYGGAGQDFGRAIAVDENGDIHVTGSIESPTNFGGGMVSVAGANDVFTLASSPANMLPVHIRSLEAEEIENQGIRLRFVLENDQRGSVYTIQKGKDGESFEAIHQRVSDGAPVAKEYRHMDRKPISKKAYYRVSVLDHNGHRSYSNIVTITPQKEGKKKCTYTCNHKKLVLNVSGNDTKPVFLTISTLNGVVVEKQTVYPGTIELNMEDKPVGYYLLRIRYSGGTQTEKIRIH